MGCFPGLPSRYANFYTYFASRHFNELPYYFFPFFLVNFFGGEDFLRSVQLSPAIHIFVSSFSIFIHFMSSYVGESVKIEF